LGSDNIPLLFITLILPFLLPGWNNLTTHGQHFQQTECKSMGHKKMFCQWDSLVMQVTHRCLNVCSRFKRFHVTCVKLTTVIGVFVRHQKMYVTQQGINYGYKLHGKDWKLCFSSRTNYLLLTLSKQNSPSHTLKCKIILWNVTIFTYFTYNFHTQIFCLKRCVNYVSKYGIINKKLPTFQLSFFPLFL